MKKIKNFLLTGALLISSLGQTAMASPFLDVGENDWYKNAVDYVYENGLMSAASEGHFLPDYPMTRGDFVSVLGKMEGITTGDYGTSAFPDIPSDSDLSPYITWAVETGMVTGYANGDFGVDDPITREQMALMIEKYLVFYSYAVPVWETVKDFSDVDSIGSWALPSAEYMKSIALMTGDAKGNFNPTQDITRAETATMITRLGGELAMVADLVGFYAGTYTAPQGDVAMTVDVCQEGKLFRAVFSFFNEGTQYTSQEGQFIQEVYRHSSTSYAFRGSEWINQPENYGYFDLIVELEGDTISGIIEMDGKDTGYTFQAKQPLG